MLTKVGRFEVYMIVAEEMEGSTSIIPDADVNILKRFIPETGFILFVNIFLIKTPNQIILIDTGFGGIIFDRMRELGVEPDQVDAVLLSHLARDHIGGLQSDGRALFPNAKVYLDALEYEHFIKIAVSDVAVAALEPYNPVTFNAASLGSPPNVILPGISAIANYGHTPGHTVFLVEDGGEKLIIAGDFLHIANVQFPYPDISATYDIDKMAAAASRRQIMDYAASNNIPIGGTHIEPPAIGRVERDGNGFRFVPIE